jgi:hypothetical protein
MCNPVDHLEQLTADQKQVFFWLNDTLKMPGFAEVYSGAVHFLNTKPSGYITFVSHAGRDLMNRLAADWLNVESGGWVDYRKLVREIHRHWESDLNNVQSLEKPKGPVEKETVIKVPVDACLAVEDLLRQHKQGNERADRQDLCFFQAFLDYHNIDMTPKNFLSEWKQARAFFLSKTHLSSTRVDDADAAVKLEEHFRFLDGMLLVAAKSEYERIKELDEILDATNA